MTTSNWHFDLEHTHFSTIFSIPERATAHLKQSKISKIFQGRTPDLPLSGYGGENGRRGREDWLRDISIFTIGPCPLLLAIKLACAKKYKILRGNVQKASASEELRPPNPVLKLGPWTTLGDLSLIHI